MREQRRGRIVNVSSMGGELTFPGGGWCHASKQDRGWDALVGRSYPRP
jgi:NADP-dependent 3-hydroxy acid dehydrogenase YdfG